MPFHIELSHAGRPVWSGSLGFEPLELGRQDVSSGPAEPEPYQQLEDRPRLIIAEKNERAISRRHAVLSMVDDTQLRVQNISATQPIICEETGEVIPPRGETVLLVGNQVHLRIHDRVLLVLSPHRQEGTGLQSLSSPTLAPGQSLLMGRDLRKSVSLSKLENADPVKIMSWLSEMIDVLQSAASSPNFLSEAAKAVVQIVGLDSGQVLRHVQGVWQPAAGYSSSGSAMQPPSKIVLSRVLEEKKTFWEVPEQGEGSLMGVMTVIASPILNAHREVIGAIYGDRKLSGGARGGSITNLEARMVEVLAYAVASGLARQAQEEEAVAARLDAAEERAKLGQFFSPKLAEQLRANPELLDGRDVEVSVLFCDVRGFSAVSERLQPADMIGWINDSLGELSDCVIEHGGVLVDYVGDEVMAMWGAPVPEEDHAERCCRAAIAMMRCLPRLDRTWRERIGMEMRVGVGVNSGLARVGNTGSKRKFKYGPLGLTVNLGSRVQGVTKWLDSPVLITEFTASKLGPEFCTRKLCRVRVINIQEPVTLYELAVDPQPQWMELKQTYEAALQAFEQREFLSATQTLGGLLRSHSGDGPSMLLLKRAVAALQSGDQFDDVFTLENK